MQLSPKYFTLTATCASVRVNASFAERKASNKIINVFNGSEDGEMSNISVNQN